MLAALPCDNIAVVPFLVSSKNYGILWDNTSRTKFGDPQDYQPLSILELFDKNGQEGGLTAEYFRNSDFSEPVTMQNESSVSYADLDEIQSVSDRIAVIFEGKITAIRDPAETNEQELGLLMAGQELTSESEG